MRGDIIKIKHYSIYFFIVLFVIISILSFLLIKPYASAILGAFVLAYLFHPIYQKIYSSTKYRNLSAALMVALVIIVILIPIFFIVNILIKEALNLYQYASSIDVNFIGNTVGYYISNDLGLNINLVNRYILDFFAILSKYFIEMASKFLVSLPKLIINVFILFFIMFYLFRDGEKLFNMLKDRIPFKKQYKNKMVNEFKSVTKAIIRGSLISAIIQGVMGGIGFYIFGIPNPLLWGFVMFILSLLPIVGPALVWVPAAIILILTGNILNGILLLVYGILAMTLLDNILRPRLISKQTDVHPMIILLGMLGGASLFGVIGILVGPVILALFVIILKTRGFREVASES